MRGGRLAAVAIGCALVACGIGVVGSAPSPDAGPAPIDAASDDATTTDRVELDASDAAVDADADAEVDAGVFVCPGGGVAPSCAACDAGALSTCPATRTCVASCRSDCAGAPIGCTTCADAGITRTCAPDQSPAASCGASQCACATEAECPFDDMVCLDVGSCATCGDVGTKDKVCKAGTGMHKCKDGTAGAGDRYLCK